MDINYQKEMYWHLDKIQNKAILSGLNIQYLDLNNVDTWITKATEYEHALQNQNEHHERFRPR
jgi:hypothetical protein